MRHCPYCGKKIYVDATECKHCDKSLVKNSSEDQGKSGLTNPKAYSERSVPAWVMYLLVGLALFASYIMLTSKKDEPAQDAPESDSDQTTIQWEEKKESDPFSVL